MVPTGIENYVVLDLVGEGSFGKVSTTQQHTDHYNQSVCRMPTSMHSISYSLIIRVRVECVCVECFQTEHARSVASTANSCWLQKQSSIGSRAAPASCL